MHKACSTDQTCKQTRHANRPDMQTRAGARHTHPLSLSLSLSLFVCFVCVGVHQCLRTNSQKLEAVNAEKARGNGSLAPTSLPWYNDYKKRQYIEYF